MSVLGRDARAQRVSLALGDCGPYDRFKLDRRVLIVEDDPADQYVARRALSRTRVPHRIEVAGTLREALQSLVRATPDVVVTDLGLPDARGLAVVEAVRAANPDVPLVVLTGDDDPDQGIAAITAGADEFVSKQRVSRELLPRAIGFAIERQRGRRLERSLEASTRLATLGQLAAGVAHEINNPAAYVLLNLELLDGLLDRLDGVDAAAFVVPEARTLVEGSLDGLRRIAAIVGELKSFTGSHDEPVGCVDLHEAVRSACAMLKGRAKGRVKLELDLQPVPQFAGYQRKLVQVVANLVVNAIEACDGGEHTICVRVSGGRDSVTLSVADDGPGIPRAVRERIFEPFFTARAAEGGTGLGLAICKQIAMQHRGELSVDTAVGEGTTFSLKIPIQTGMLPVQDAPQRQEGPASPRLRVLIVEDEPLLRRAYGKMFERLHDVVVAGDGVEALAAVEADAHFDAILCDMAMPRLDGPGLFETLQRRGSALVDRFVFCTGGALDARARAFLETHGKNVLAKPLKTRQIVGAVEAVGRAGRTAASRPKLRALG